MLLLLYIIFMLYDMIYGVFKIVLTLNNNG